MLIADPVQKQNAGRSGMIWVGLVVAMYASATVHLAVNWWFQVRSWSVPTQDPLGSAAWALVSPPGWVQILLGLALTLSVLLADCLFVCQYYLSFESRHKQAEPDLEMLACLGA